MEEFINKILSMLPNKEFLSLADVAKLKFFGNANSSKKFLKENNLIFYVTSTSRGIILRDSLIKYLQNRLKDNHKIPSKRKGKK